MSIGRRESLTVGPLGRWMDEWYPEETIKYGTHKSNPPVVLKGCRGCCVGCLDGSDDGIQSDGMGTSTNVSDVCWVGLCGVAADVLDRVFWGGVLVIVVVVVLCCVVDNYREGPTFAWL